MLRVQRMTGVLLNCNRVVKTSRGRRLGGRTAEQVRGDEDCHGIGGGRGAGGRGKGGGEKEDEENRMRKSRKRRKRRKRKEG